MRLPTFFLNAVFLLGTGVSSFCADRRYAVIVHNSNPRNRFTLTELRALFSGAMPRWPNQQTVILVERDSADSATRYLITTLLGTTDAEYRRRLAGIEFMGEDGVVVKTLKSDEAACQFVFNVPAAIGFIDASSLDKPACRKVRVAGVGGHLPTEEAYALK